MRELLICSVPRFDCTARSAPSSPVAAPGLRLLRIHLSVNESPSFDLCVVFALEPHLYALLRLPGYELPARDPISAPTRFALVDPLSLFHRWSSKHNIVTVEMDCGSFVLMCAYLTIDFWVSFMVSGRSGLVCRDVLHPARYPLVSAGSEFSTSLLA